MASAKIVLSIESVLTFCSSSLVLLYQRFCYGQNMLLQRYYVVLVLMAALLVAPLTGFAQIFQVPCEFIPEDPFCQDQCSADPGLSWCESSELERDPIVLIPGITVSQNKKLLYEDKEGGEWKFAFLFNVYKGLIKKLESAGYEEGEDLLVAHYDWRNPASYNASAYLKPIIDQAKQATGASKVDVVAHSFGGVVARAYIQSEGYGNDVDQLITLGSPHEGAADSYVAWEGGVLPEGWNFWMRKRVTDVEEALKITRNQSAIRAPDSFRAFFPSLRDMLPLNDFVMKGESSVAIGDLTEQNLFLKSLRETLDSIVAKGIELTTIAGTSVNTLGQVSVANERTREDEKLNRWRDGHPDPDPPPLNSTAGDARVLLDNAHIGEGNITLNDAVHHKLPDEAQDEVFEILGLEPEPSFFSDFPEKVFGIVILSPIEARIEGPNGEILSRDRNDFGGEMAEYDDDPDDPDDPIEITIADPPVGDYTITYTGTGEGEYTIITSYADEDETVSSVKDGMTYLGEVMTETVSIGSETTSLIDDEDYKVLLEEIILLAKEAQKSKMLHGREWAWINSTVVHASNDLRRYEQWTSKGREAAALSSLRSYYENLRGIEGEVHRIGGEGDRADFAQQIIQLVEKIERYSPPL